MKLKNLLENLRKSLISWLRPGYIILVVLFWGSIFVVGRYHHNYKLGKIGIKSTELCSDKQPILEYLNQNSGAAILLTYFKESNLLIIRERLKPGPLHPVPSDDINCKHTPFFITPAVFHQVRETSTKSGWHFYQLNTKQECWAGMPGFIEPLEEWAVQYLTDCTESGNKMQPSFWSFYHKSRLIIFIGICVLFIVFFTLVSMKYAEEPETS